jgi:hypothetical protein
MEFRDQRQQYTGRDESNAGKQRGGKIRDRNLGEDERRPPHQVHDEEA